MLIEAGQQLLQYRLIEQIGEGGMGVVWKALDTSLEREVAIKVLPADVSRDDARRLHLHEPPPAAAVAQAKCPRIGSYSSRFAAIVRCSAASVSSPRFS